MKKKVINYISAIIFLAVLAIVYLAYTEPTVAFDSNAFKLKGLYGVNIPLAEIKEADIVTLRDMPPISMRANGISFLKVHRGKFRTTEGDNIHLNINTGVNAVIRIVDSHGNAYYINRKNEDETRRIFDTIARQAQ